MLRFAPDPMNTPGSYQDAYQAHRNPPPAQKDAAPRSYQDAYQAHRKSSAIDSPTTPSKPKSLEVKTAPARSTPTSTPPELSKLNARNNNASVKDKIAMWQKQEEVIVYPSSSVASGSDVEASARKARSRTSGSPRSTPKPEGSMGRASPAITPKHSAVDVGGASLESHPTSPKKPQHNDLDEEMREAIMPKKRLVSDGHWRKERSPTKETPSKDRSSPAQEAYGWKKPKAPEGPSPPKPIPTPLIAYMAGVTIPPTAARARRKSEHHKSTSEDSAPKKEADAVGTAAKKAEADDATPTKKATTPRMRTKSTPLLLSPHSKIDIVKKTTSAKKAVTKEPPVPPGTTPRTLEYVRNTNPQDFEDAELSPVEEHEHRRRRRRSSRKQEHATEGDYVEEVPVRRRSPTLSPALEDISHNRRRASKAQHEKAAETPRETRAEPANTAKSSERSISGNKLRKQPPKEHTATTPPEPAPFTPPRQVSTKIEAWLGSTPDPFVDDKPRASKRSPADTVTSTSPSEVFSSEAGPSTAATSQVSSAYESVSVDDRGDVRRRSRSHTMGASKYAPAPTESTVSTDISSALSTPSLKRSGARKGSVSPTKERPRSLTLCDNPSAEDVASAASSVDPSTFHAPDITPRARPGGNGATLKRGFPTTGKRLSTIASVETFNTKAYNAAPSIAEGSEPGIAEEGAVVSKKTSLKRRLTKHGDLMSVLSIPNDDAKSVRSARSVRTNRVRIENATIGDLLDELAVDEFKYMRELRTLVDGVIPVLLTCVLSKSDSAVAAGLFSKSASNDGNVTRPIMDMGIALERLKSNHRRIPTKDANALVGWATHAAKAYSEYIKVWRLGFQDVVVNLAPAANGSSPVRSGKGGEDGAWNEGMPQNAEGYVINSDGERVDVAFLLKRPLVRLKYLAKTFKGLQTLQPSEGSGKASTDFQNLVSDARKRTDEERARLEDEAAAAIDATRARDPKSLVPLAGVRIDPSRCVGARDYFDMHLMHSSGQRVDCRVEIFLRDEGPGRSGIGDLLVCEVDGSGRWLFFPPLHRDQVSARTGDNDGELVVMLRGLQSGGREWRELLTLRTEEFDAITDWLQMLGSSPLPPALPKVEDSIQSPYGPTSSHDPMLLTAGPAPTTPQKSRTPSPREVEVPIGEQALPTAKRWDMPTPPRYYAPSVDSSSSITTPSREGNKLRRSSGRSPVSPPDLSTVYSDDSRPRSRDKPPVTFSEPLSRRDEYPDLSPGIDSSTGLRRNRAMKRLSKLNPFHSNSAEQADAAGSLDRHETVVRHKHSRSAPQTPRGSKENRGWAPTETLAAKTAHGHKVWYPPSDSLGYDDSDKSDSDEDDVPLSSSGLTRPGMHRRASSVPSLDLPTIPKIRKTSQPSTPLRASYQADDLPAATIDREHPSSAPSKLQKKQPARYRDRAIAEPEVESKAPQPPVHRDATPTKLKETITPSLTPTSKAYQSSTPTFLAKRRSSSPLKHEYEPSTASESDSDGLGDDASITSDSSDDEDLETSGMAMPLPPLSNNKLPVMSPPSSIFTHPAGTINPESSASQMPYRRVPEGVQQAAKLIASIFAWSDKGMWEALHHRECSVVISAGRIEAYEMNADHSKPLNLPNQAGSDVSQAPRPLVALELTPVVMLRKGTALDISIRSPPTVESLIQCGNNVMFRSRSAEECDHLYYLINQARINNPTYLALQQARPGQGEGGYWAAAMDRQNAQRTASGKAGSTTGGSSSWWKVGSSLSRTKSYRASTKRAASMSGGTDSSVGTMQSAFSALKRFSGAGAFNVGKSTVSSRDSLGSFSLGDGSGSGGSGASTPAHGRHTSGLDAAAAAQKLAGGAMPFGINNYKIRLYLRESASKWRDMGAARLHIMNPEPGAISNSPGANRLSQSAPGSPTVPAAVAGLREKRIVVEGKTKSESLLDVTLSESCFERVARTGIAISVWEDTIGADGVRGGIAAQGGVNAVRARVYMVQLKTERECAYAFSLLGRLRY